MEVFGKINVYVCERCRTEFTTIDAAIGITPFLIRCRLPGCGDAMAQSSFYRVDQDRRPGWEWYRPAADQASGLDAAAAAHVGKGGLLLRKIRPETLEQFGFQSRRA